MPHYTPLPGTIGGKVRIWLINLSTFHRWGQTFLSNPYSTPHPVWGVTIGDFDEYRIYACQMPLYMGLGFYINPPMLAPIVPGRGVMRHYIDKCIIGTCACNITPAQNCNVQHCNWQTKILAVQIATLLSPNSWKIWCGFSSCVIIILSLWYISRNYWQWWIWNKSFGSCKDNPSQIFCLYSTKLMLQYYSPINESRCYV